MALGTILSCLITGQEAFDLDRTQIAQLCDRHRGIGADGILLLENPTNRADFRMRLL
jgi:diaminopimelate epimerase